MSDNFTYDQRLRLQFGWASNLYTCTMLQSVQRRGIHSATDGAMFYKEPFCLGTLSTDQFVNGIQHWLQQSLL